MGFPGSPGFFISALHVFASFPAKTSRATSCGITVFRCLHRRHLTESQRAMVAAKLANMPLGGATYRSANLPTESVSQSDAAELLNVSERSVNTAKAIQRTATRGNEVCQEVPTQCLQAVLRGESREVMRGEFAVCKPYRICG
jgi:hypothetical protein